MIQHYFIGIQIPGKEAAIFDQKKNFMELQKSHKIPVAPEDMHITLVYLGAVEKEVLHKLIQEIEIVAPKNSSFQLTSSQVKVFGNPSKPRVVYANIEENPVLMRLQKVLATCMNFVSMNYEEKKYVPHITLAKKWRDTEQFRALSTFNEPITFEVKHFYIYEIHPNKSPKYKPIAMFQLGEA
ncbi:MAG: RNA 2',3'-cyclic phosphodiesterase [Paenisporosarcina sp.]